MTEWVKLEDKRTPPDEVELRVARLTALAVQVFGNRRKAMGWLRRPRREFGGISPLEMMETPAAARQVEAHLLALDDATKS